MVWSSPTYLSGSGSPIPLPLNISLNVTSAAHPTHSHSRLSLSLCRSSGQISLISKLLSIRLFIRPRRRQGAFISDVRKIFRSIPPHHSSYVKFCLSLLTSLKKASHVRASRRPPACPLVCLCVPALASLRQRQQWNGGSMAGEIAPLSQIAVAEVA